jgi:hypothetical protein
MNVPETRHALSSRRPPDPAGRALLPLLALFGVFALFVAVVVAASGCGKVAAKDDGAADGGDPGGPDDEGEADDGADADDPDGAADDADDPGDGGDADDGDDGGEPTPLTCVGRSGERIRQVVRNHDDGSSEVLGLTDTDIDAPCSFRVAGDGVERCLPVEDEARMPVFFPVYTDAGCTSRIAEFHSTEPALPRHAMVAVGSEPFECQRTFDFVELGAAVPLELGDTIYYLREDGSCESAFASPGPYRYSRITSVLPDSRFVGGTGRWTDGGRLAMRVVEGADGSRACVAGSFSDAERGPHPCSPQEDVGGQLRCLPASPPLSGAVSTSASCTDSLVVAQVADGCDQGMDYIRRPTLPGCRSRTSVYERGAAHAGQLYFPFSPTICYPVPTGYAYHELGGLLPPPTFPVMTERIAASKTRLARVEVEGGGVHMPRPLWQDTELDVPCEFELAVDGVTRCLPGPSADEHNSLVEPFRATAQGLVVQLYESDECQGPAPRHVLFQDGGCDARPPPRYAIERTFEGQRIFRVGERITRPFHLPSSCRALGPEMQVFALGEEVDPTEFVAGAEEVE